ncbi:MAG: Sapep family Mn(2+)-dependent dipeptidase [Myxococcota bacterium]|nr:Sapep family Mn(2+)-dependent dipeptidase [Myxococcota bacterium]
MNKLLARNFGIGALLLVPLAHNSLKPPPLYAQTPSSPQAANVQSQWNPQSIPSCTSVDTHHPLVTSADLHAFPLKHPCWKAQILHYLKQLVQFRTVRINESPNEHGGFLKMKQFLMDWANHFNLVFTSYQDDEVWEISTSSGPRDIAYITHADVVPATNSMTTPFQLVRKSDRWCARGSEDNKGPIAVAMTLLPILKTTAAHYKKNISLLIGTGEETNWKGMETFAEKTPRIPFPISLDSSFPIVNGEFGYVSWYLEFGQTGLTLPKTSPFNLDFAGAGQTLNQIPPDGIIRIGIDAPLSLEKANEMVRDHIEKISKTFPADAFEVSLESNSLERWLMVRVKGRAAHASTPEEGSNPIWFLASLVTSLGVNPSPTLDALTFIDKFLTNDHYGAKLGISTTHPLMGKLVIAPTILKHQEKTILVGINIRRPIGESSENFKDKLVSVKHNLQDNFGWQLKMVREPYVGEATFTSPDSPLPRILLKAYRKVSNDQINKAKSVRGGTYAKLFPGAINFGPSLPEDQYTGHTQNECIRDKQIATLFEGLLLGSCALFNETRE